MRDRTLTLLFLRWCERGDGRALAAVFDAYARPLLELASHLVRDPAEAEDLVQATFLAALRRAARFDASSPLEGWLYGILWREAARARRRAARRVDPARLAERAEADPADAAAAGEVPEAVAAALARLPQRYREVLEPLLFDERRPESIARDLARSPGTVRSQIHRGLEELRRALAPRFASHAALALPARGLGAVRAAVLESAGFSPATVATSGAAALSLVAGGVLVSKSIVVAGSVAVLLAVGTWVALERPSEAGRGAREASRDGLAPVADTEAEGGEPPATEGASAASREGAGSSTPAGAPPAAGSTPLDVEHWLARFAEAPEDWRHGWAVAQEIAALPPDEALAVMTAVWPHLSVPVKEQALKPFVFGAGHVHALELLHVAATDSGAPSVQARAFEYLKQYAFRDFGLDYEAYVAWRARTAGRPLGEVLRESAASFASDLLALSPAELERRMRELDRLDLRAGGAAGLDLAAELRAAGAERVLEAALASSDPDTARRALEWSKELAVDERWLRAWVLPRIASPDPATPLSACFDALARPDCAWARDEVLAHLEHATREPSLGARSAARALAEMKDPAAIPAMIGLLLRDRTGELDYDVGYFGLAQLTGVRWQESYDGAWWAEWWERNRARFPAEVAALAVPR